MMFVLRMAVRTLRSTWRRLLLFFLCIAVGSAAIIAVRSTISLLRSSVTRESRVLVGADAFAGTASAWTPAARAALEQAAASPMVVSHTELVILQTMARSDRADSRPVMVELRGVQPSFPLHGSIELTTGSYDPSLLANKGVLVSPSVLTRLQISAGDLLVIGGQRFVIRGTMAKLPGTARDFSPTPRVLVAYGDVLASGLLQFGSRARHEWLFRTIPNEEQRFVRALGPTMRGTAPAGVYIGTFRYVEGFINASLANIEGFFSLIALSIIVLGGIGIGSVTRLFVENQLKTIAILKCLGGRNLRVLGSYALQVVALALAGCIAGIGGAFALTRVISSLAYGRLPFALDPGLTLRATAQGVGIGILVALLFSLPSLLEIRSVKPVLVLRPQPGYAPRRFDPLRLLSIVLLVGGLLGLAAWQSGPYRSSWIFVAGLALAAAILSAASVVLARALRPLTHARRFDVRYAARSLGRPGNQTKVVLFAVGVGSVLMISMQVQQANALGSYRLDLDSLTKDLFFIDVQQDQAADARTTLTLLGATEVALIPITRGRVVGFRGGPAGGRDEELARRRIGGQFSLSYRGTLDPADRIVAGTFWPDTASASPEVSVEDRLAESWLLRVGDVLVFDIGGRRFEATVTSLRRVDRRARSFDQLTRTDILFRPGALDSIPHTFIGTAKGPPPGAERTRLQSLFADQFPNVTIIDAQDEIREIRGRIADISRAVFLLGALVFGCGILILTGSVAMTQLQRLYESAVLKTLGARSSVILRITAVEYAILGTIAGSVGALVSVVLTWALSKYGSGRIVWHPQPMVLGFGLLATAVLVTAVGLAASWSVVTRKPIATLKADV